MRFLKAALVWFLCIALSLNATLAHAQALNSGSNNQGSSSGSGSSGSSSGGDAYYTGTDWSKPESSNNNNNAGSGSDGEAVELELKDTMNFEECVDYKVTPSGWACKSECSGLSVSLGFNQYDYYEPIALVESVPEPWVTLFKKDLENDISKKFTKFKRKPMGGDQGVQTIKTSKGNYPQRYFETHVWGIPVPTRVMMLHDQIMQGKPPTDPRTQAMTYSLTYEFGTIAAEMSGSGEINSLQDAARAFENVVANFFTMGGYTWIKTLKAIKAMYETAKDLYDLFMMFMDALKALKAMINDPLQTAIKELIKLVVGKDCKEGSSSTNADTSSYYTGTDWNNPDGSNNNNNTYPGPVTNDDPNKGCKDTKKESLYSKMVKKIKEIIKDLKEDFGEIITALQLEKAWKVFANFAKSIANSFKEFTDGWTTKAGKDAETVGQEAQTCANPNWLCSAQYQLNGAKGNDSPLYTGTDWSAVGTGASSSEGPNASEQNANGSMQNVYQSSSAVDSQIEELGGSCNNGQPVGQWGNSVMACDYGQALEGLSSAMDAINKMQDIFHTGTIVNVMGSAAGALIPIKLIPAFTSENFRPSWNKGTANMIAIFQSMVASTPWMCAGTETVAALGQAFGVAGFGALSDSMKRSFCIGIWGPIYPKVGSVPIDDPSVAAGITNFRGFSIAASWGTFPIPYNAKKAGGPRFNVDHPYKGKKCYDVGTISPKWNSKTLNEGGSAALDGMTGGLAGAVSNVATVMKSVADNPVQDIKQGSKTDGWVHTYWKKTRVCESVCSTGVKWKKVY